MTTKTNPVEALLEGIANLKGWNNPDSYNYQIKNPLGVRSFAKPGKHETDEEGLRIFPSWLAGYKACQFDLEMKVSGKSRAGLRDGATLADLLRVYGLSEKLGQDQVVKYLKRALKDPSITRELPLTYFTAAKE